MKLWKGLTGKNIYFDGAKSALILEDWFRWTMTRVYHMENGPILNPLKPWLDKYQLL